MIFSQKSVGSTVEILAADQFVGIPVTVTGDVVVKAGTPLTETGAAVLDGSGAVGILLYDVDPSVNPNAAMVIQGVIDWTKAAAHSGATADATTMKGILPGIVFRTNVG